MTMSRPESLRELLTTAPAVLQLDQPAEHVLRVLINRPDKRNAMDFEVREALTQVISAALAMRDCRALVLGGVAGVFSAGGDVPSMIGLSEADARARMRHIHTLCRLVAGAGIPVISVIEGVGAGAAVGLALLGDHIVAGERSRLLFPFMKLGLTPDWGTLLTLPRRIGLPAARRVLTSGQFISGPEALEIGLVDALVPDAEVMPAAIRHAEQMAGLPLDAFARMKRRLAGLAEALDQELAREEADQAVCLLGAEFEAGVAGFMEKRAVDFTGVARQLP